MRGAGKKLLLAALLLVALSLCACSLPEQRQTLEEMFARFRSVTDVSLEAELTVSTGGQEQRTRYNFAVRQDSPSRTAVLSLPDSRETFCEYDNLFFSLYYGDIDKVGSGSLAGEFGDILDTLMPDLTALEYKLTVVPLPWNQVTVYRLRLDAQDAGKLLRLNSLKDMRFQTCLLELTMDENNRFPRVIRIRAAGKGTQVTLFIRYNMIDEGVKVEIPKCVLDYVPEEDFYPPDSEYLPGPNVSDDYVNTQDGALQYHELGNYRSVAYEAQSDRLFVARRKSVDVYQAPSMEKLRTLEFDREVVCMDADSGVLAVGLWSDQIRTFDTATLEPLEDITAGQVVAQLVLDGDSLIFVDEDQWCDIVIHSLSTGERKTVANVYSPKLAINRRDHILYVGERKLSSTELIYMDSRTGEIFYRSDFSEFVYNETPVTFDGANVHYSRVTFAGDRGLRISSGGLASVYRPLQDFRAWKTVFDSQDLAMVLGADAWMGVYSHAQDAYIYRFRFYTEKVFAMRDGRYLLTDCGRSYAAILDLSDVDGALAGNLEFPDSADSVTKENGISILRRNYGYQLSASDGEYLYLLNTREYVLDAYRVEGFEKVFSQRFALRPVCMDAAYGKVIVGFGEGRQIWYFDGATGRYTVHRMADAVYSAVLYRDEIIYAPIDQHCLVYRYCPETGQGAPLEKISCYYVSMAIDRASGILYLGDRSSSSCPLIYYDLNRDTVLYRSAHGENSYNRDPVRFDGNFVHFYGRTYHAGTGAVVSSTSASRNYAGYSFAETVFDDGEISVFRTGKDGAVITVIYHVSTGTFAEYAFDSSGAYRVGSAVLLTADGGNDVWLVSGSV